MPRSSAGSWWPVNCWSVAWQRQGKLIPGESSRSSTVSTKAKYTAMHLNEMGAGRPGEGWKREKGKDEWKCHWFLCPCVKTVKCSRDVMKIERIAEMREREVGKLKKKNKTGYTTYICLLFFKKKKAFWSKNGQEHFYKCFVSLAQT